MLHFTIIKNGCLNPTYVDHGGWATSVSLQWFGLDKFVKPCGQLWARSIGEAISILTQNRDRNFLTSQHIPTLRDRSRWPSRSFKIFEVSQEKSGFSLIFLDFPQLSPIFPDLSRSQFVKKSGWPSRSRSRSTRPDPIFLQKLSPSRYLAHSWHILT